VRDARIGRAAINRKSHVMKRIALLSAVTVVATIASSGAYAVSNRTFVSGTGSDSNPCSLSAPCRSFAVAVTQTSPGGEIAVLDTAGYGAVTITQAVSIVNEEGVEAGITVTSGDGITITAGASDVINLRGLTIVGAGGNNGITFTSGGALNIQNCVIRGFGNDGLNLVPTNSADINVSTTIVSGNDTGINLSPSGTNINVTASFEQVQVIHNSGDGVNIFANLMTGSLRALAADSLASGNHFNGFASVSAAGKAVATLTLTGSKAANNDTGVQVGSSAVVFLNGSTISGNSSHGFFIAGGSNGVINSYGNNAITDPVNSGSLTSVVLR
jgi:hypothetical protein